MQQPASRVTGRSVALVAAALSVAPLLAGCANSGASTVAVDSYPPGHLRVGEVSGTTLQGARLSLSTLRGHVVVVDFWQSNCAPCRAEQSYLNAVQRRTANAGVRFVGIDERDVASQARAFLADHPASYPSLSDPDGALSLEFAGAEPETTPTTIILDRAGDVVERINGSVYYTQLLDLVDKTVSAGA